VKAQVFLKRKTWAFFIWKKIIAYPIETNRSIKHLLLFEYTF